MLEGRGPGGRRVWLVAWEGSKMGRARFSSPLSKIIYSSKHCRFESHRLAVLKSVPCVCYARSTDEGSHVHFFTGWVYSFSIDFWMIPVSVTLPMFGFYFFVFDKL